MKKARVLTLEQHASENSKNLAACPTTGELVKPDIAAVQGETLECGSCGKTHMLQKTNGDGTRAILV